MTFDDLLKLLGLLLSASGLTLGLLKYYFEKANKFEADKMKARAKIKDLEGTLQKVFLDQMREKVSLLEAHLSDIELKFENMYSEYSKMSKELQLNTVKLQHMSDQYKDLFREVRQNIKGSHGNVYVIPNKGDE